MVRNGVIAAAMLAALVHAAAAGVVLVDPTGGGDFETLPEAWTAVGSGDTVLMAPGVHEVGAVPGWPLTLDDSSPSVVGPEGAAATILQGDGTSAAFFIPEDVHTAHMHFAGLTFRDIGELIVRDGEYGESGGSLAFVDNVVENCGTLYALDASQCSASSVIARNLIAGNPGRGINTYHYLGLVEDNEICYNLAGISGACCEHPTIVGNHIHHNSEYGIRSGFDYVIESNIIEHNGGIGLLLVSDGMVRYNIIRNNDVGVKHEGQPLTEFWHNDVYDNSLYNVEVDWVSIAYWYCDHNWWGTTNAAEIEAGIRDCDDDAAVGVCVSWYPCCDAPGCASDVRPATWGAIKARYR
jgi:hypothetical protein